MIVCFGGGNSIKVVASAKSSFDLCYFPFASYFLCFCPVLLFLSSSSHQSFTTLLFKFSPLGRQPTMSAARTFYQLLHDSVKTANRPLIRPHSRTHFAHPGRRRCAVPILHHPFRGCSGQPGASLFLPSGRYCWNGKWYGAFNERMDLFRRLLHRQWQVL